MKKLTLVLFMIIFIMMVVPPSNASDEELFTAVVPPDTLIILDMSGSMNWDPAGNAASSPNRRIDIARNVIFDLLDDNNDSVVNQDDEPSLNIRLGYMRFRSIGAADNDDGDPFNGNIKVFEDETEIGAHYHQIWNRVSDAAETAQGCTPLGATLVEAKKYFLDHVNPMDAAIACRQKFIVFVTDGSDTVGCDGDCSEEAPDMWKRRMLTVQRAKEVYDAGIQVFSVGFGGSMPDHLKKTLNWVAKHGGTLNPDPDVPKTADNYNITDHLPADNNVCALTSDTGDPAKFNISGYAFLTENASQLSEALKTILAYIKQKSFSFTAPTVPTVRLVDEEDNVIYISSFVPSDTPFWKGNLKKYKLSEEGILPVDAEGNPIVSDSLWGIIFDPVLQKEVAAGAADKLKAMAPDSRKIFTVKNNALMSFEYDNLTNEDLNVTSDSERADLINHIRGIDAFDVNGNGNKTEMREWKLGDIFHSNPVIVGSPSKFFIDQGFSGSGGFYEEKKGRKKIVIIGANDGMLHAFDASNGVELWAFIPNAVLKTLNSMETAHTYYVDSSPKVADVWFDTNGDGQKTSDEWRTVLICGLRKGGKHYFALDITDTQNPKYLWEFPQKATVLDRIGQSWSEPAIGRVKIEKGSNLVEKWVGFMGGGYDPYDQKKGTEATMGNVFFVINVMTGDIIKEFSGLELMRHSFAAPPTAVDADQNGYVDKVYAGDLAGQMWVFDVSVSFVGGTLKSDSRWGGKRLFMAPKEPLEKHNSYYQPAVAFDKYGNPWVYYGTGDKENPTDTINPQERFYAVIDDGNGPYPRVEKDLKDVTKVNTFSVDRTKKGWFIQLEKTGNRLEKVMGKAAVFNKLLYFTTFFYDDKADPCSVSGDSRLYIVEYLSGGGALVLEDYMKGTPSERSRIIGEGVPSSPVITVNMKGKDSVIIGTTSGDYYSTKVHSPATLKEILFWREVVP